MTQKLAVTPTKALLLGAYWISVVIAVFMAVMLLAGGWSL